VSSPAHQVQRCANATSPRLFHGTDGGPRPHDVDSDDEDDDEDDGDDIGYYRVILVQSGTETPRPSHSNVSLCLEQLASLSSPPARHHHRGTIVPRPRFLSAPVLLRATHYLAGDTMLTDGSRPTYHRHPHVQNPASGVNVPEFPRVSLLNMHLLRAPGRAGKETGGWQRVGRAVQRDSFYLSRCSRLECGMTVFAIT